MSSVRRVLTSLCVALTVSAAIPCRADSGDATPGSDRAGAMMALPGFGAAPLGTALPLSALMQTTATTSSGRMSGKKKAWIIAGAVLGAIAIGVAVSNHHSGGGGGGGY